MSSKKDDKITDPKDEETAVDADNKSSSEGHTDTNKEKIEFFEDMSALDKKTSPLIYIIVLLFILLGFLIFGYVYNIAGLRDIANKSDKIETVKKEKTISSLKKEDKKGPIKAEKQPSVQQKAAPEAIKIKKTVQAEKPQKPKSIFMSVAPKKAPAYALSKQKFQNYDRAIQALIDGLVSKKPYIDALVRVKMMFPKQELGALTQYATSGFPGQFKIAQRGVAAVGRAAFVTEQSKEEGHVFDVDDFMRHFVVITPKEDIAADKMNAKLKDIKSQFENGDFKKAQNLIGSLPPGQQRAFADVTRDIRHMYDIEDELRHLRSALTEALFASD